MQSNFIRNLSIALLGSIILLGEAFKVNFGISLSLPLLLIIIYSAILFSKNTRFYFTGLDKLIYVYGFIFLIFGFVGFISGNFIGDILEDAYPTAAFLVLYILWRSLECCDVQKIWQSITGITLLACLKVVLIWLVPYEVLWNNNWQALKEPLPLGNYYRIILRGGDIFLSIILVHFIIQVQGKASGAILKKLFFIAILIFSVFISLSRSSFLGIAVALVITFVLFSTYFSKVKLLIFMISLGLFVIALLPFFNAISLAASIFEARTEAFDANNIATEFREEERNLILDKASSYYYMGNGLGSFIYLDLSGSDKKDERSIYSHDFNSWLIFKTGVVGLLCFYGLFFSACYNFYWCLMRKNHPLNQRFHMLILSVFAGGIVIWVISFLANKFSTLSGSVFLAFFCAASAIFRKRYESSI